MLLIILHTSYEKSSESIRVSQINADSEGSWCEQPMTVWSQ